MKDLRSRSNALLLVLGLMPLLGCMILDASPYTSTTSGLEAVKSTLNFGVVVLGDYTVVNDTLVNSSDASITISQATVSGTQFEISEPAFPITLAPRQQVQMSVTFTPTSAGQAPGSVVLANNGPTPSLTLNLAAAAVVPGFLVATPSNISFGTVMVGKSVTRQETFTNPGGTNVTITQATPSQSNFTVSGLPLPIILKPNQSASFGVVFTPLTSGATNGTLTMATRAAGWAHGRRGQYHRAVPVFGTTAKVAPAVSGEDDDLTIPVSGMATTSGLLTATPSITFTSTPVGKSQGLSDTLTNTGGSSITVSQVTATGPGFSVTGLSLPLTIAAGQSTSFTVVFSPQSAGTASGNVAITSDSSNPSVNTTLSGTGVTAGSLTASPSSISFGSIQVSKSQTSTETLTNSGGSSVTISQASATGAGFSLSGITLPLTLPAGQSTSFSVAFAPQTSGAVTGGITITSNASNPSLAVALSGTGTTPGTLGASQSSLSFGSVQVSKSSAASETITNTGASSVTITQVNVTGAGFSVPGLSLPVTLTAGQSLTFSGIFAPQNTGAVTGSISVISNASNATLTISLSGTGTAAGLLTVSPATLSFGNVTVGTGKSLTGSLSATGASVTLSSGSSSSTEFVISGISFPLTIAAGQSASFTVKFTPQGSGIASASVTFASNASNTSAVGSLTGTGVAAVQHQVALAWNASTSSVVGYNVYRGALMAGPFTKINAAPIAITGFTDTAVTAGQSYFYLTTAVDSDGGESTYSNEVAATIPTP